MTRPSASHHNVVRSINSRVQVRPRHRWPCGRTPRVSLKGLIAADVASLAQTFLDVAAAWFADDKLSLVSLSNQFRMHAAGRDFLDVIVEILQHLISLHTRQALNGR